MPWPLALALTAVAGAAGAIAGERGDRAHGRTSAMRLAARQAAAQPPAGRVLTGEGALGDWTTDAPGVRRRITVADLPRPYATPLHRQRSTPGRRPRTPGRRCLPASASSCSRRASPIRARSSPRPTATSSWRRANRAASASCARPTARQRRRRSPSSRRVCDLPFGTRLLPARPRIREYLYVGNTGCVVRFPYRGGDLKASGRAGDGGARHPQRRPPARRRTLDARRSLLARRAARCSSPSARTRTSSMTPPNEPRRRAGVQPRRPGRGNLRLGHPQRRRAGDPPGHGRAVGLGERAGRTGRRPRARLRHHIQDGGFYGWPWFYIGPHQDPRHEGAHPELRDKVIVPDVLVQSHSASLCMMFYTGSAFPKEYRRDAFAAEHGSWNRAEAHRLQGDPRPHAQRKGDRRVRGLS